MPVRVTSSCGSRPSHEKKKHVMSAEDRALAKEKRERNKALNDARQLWDATLPDAWVPGSTRFRHQNGTAVMFKSDAKKSFGLTEREILTLPHESIPGSLKTYFDLSAVRALHHRKFEAGALFEEIDHRFTFIRVLLSSGAGSRQSKKNFFDPHPHTGTTLKMHDALYGPEARIACAEAQKKKAAQESGCY
ncbi:hypothetical protein C8F01DRAFT_1083748 [Mycena amicta]|nr:hypothetical protein C8F01DRAFT_1083748 [Mycena amicta]